MRTRKRVSFTVKEEGGEDVHRRSSPRKKSRTDYSSKEGSDDKRDSDSDSVEENNSEEEHPSWPVTCGNKKGLLHVVKLERGQVCIESEGQWFSPSAFEQFGGKGASKKWKTSIVYDDYPLQYWIDCGDLIPARVKKNSYNNTSLPEASAENGNHVEAEGAAETEEVQNGERTNATVKAESILLKKIPMLILHKLEHLQGDFHLLLNNVVLPKKASAVPREEMKEEKAEDGLDTEESSGPLEETLPQDNSTENEDAPSVSEQFTVPDLHNTDVNVEEVVIEDTPSAGEESDDEPKEFIPELGQVFLILEKDDEPEEEIKDSLGTKESSEPQEETLPQDSNSKHEEDSMQTEQPNVPQVENAKGKAVDLSSPTENTNETNQNEVEMEAVEFPTTKESSKDIVSPDANMKVQHQLLIERPSPEKNLCTVMYDQVAAAQGSAELEVMDLEQLKREKLKMQIKVLRLQEEYYSLQLKKMKQ